MSAIRPLASISDLPSQCLPGNWERHSSTKLSCMIAPQHAYNISRSLPRALARANAIVCVLRAIGRAIARAVFQSIPHARICDNGKHI